MLVVVSVLARDSARFDGPLDPRNPGRDGAQALARVLDAHGRAVDGGARAGRRCSTPPVDATTTVVVTDPGELGPSTLRRLRTTPTTPRPSCSWARPTPSPRCSTSAPPAPVTGTRPAGCDTPLARGPRVRTCATPTASTPPAASARRPSASSTARPGC